MRKKILEKLSELYYAIFFSFDSKPETGWDPRKITAWAIIALAAYTHITYVKEDIAIEVLSIDYTFVLLLLGVVTAEQYLKYKQDKKDPGNNGQEPPTP